MRFGRWSSWLLVLAFMAALVAIASVQGTSEHEQKSENGPQYEGDFFGDEGYEDYEGEEGGEYDQKQEYAPPTQQAQGQYYPMPVYQAPQMPEQYGNKYEQQQPPPPQYVPQPAQHIYQPLPPPVIVESYPQPAPVYQQHQQQQQPNYTVVEQPPVYQQEVAYHPPKQEVVYAPPQPKQEIVYAQPQPKQEVVYKKPEVVVYPQPQPQPQPQQVYPKPQVVVANYTPPPPPAPVVTVVKQQTYVQAPPAPQPIVIVQPGNYSQLPAPIPYKQPPNPREFYSPGGLTQKYSLTALAPFTLPFGFRGDYANQLHYYKFLNYAKCPKQSYAQGTGRGVSPQDIQQAFAFAISQTGYPQGQMNGGAIQYMNSSSLSFAARHQIASYLSQKNARMDEEGLLVEFVSIYLADRLCMSKWDRHRMLPSMTRLIATQHFPKSHSCSQYYGQGGRANSWQWKNCYASKYRNYDGFCNNPYHPWWGKSNVCHIRLLGPDYADGLSMPRESYNGRYALPNPRLVANVISNDVPLEGPYNLMKMQWGQFINHDISQTALSSYDGLVDCCRQPNVRGCWPIPVLPGDRFYSQMNVTCLNFIRSGACANDCQLGPRQQTNKNTAFLDASHVYGNSQEQAMQLRAFVGGLMKSSSGRSGEQLLPVSTAQEQCFGVCYQAGDSRVNQHPALTALHTLMLRNHNRHAQNLARRHPNWNDEILFQEARRINIAEYQMITYAEYLPIVFGPVLTSYYKLAPQYAGHTQYNAHVDPTTWNEYTTAACRFGHSQISSVFGLYSRIASHGQSTEGQGQDTFRLKEWFFRPSLLAEGLIPKILNGLLARPSLAVDPWVTTDVRNHLYQTPKERFGGDLIATNIWRGRDHGIAGYVHYLEYCFNYKVRGWKDLQIFIPAYTLGQMRKLYRVVENIDLYTGGLSERHFPGADIGPTFACVNGIQYHHLKFGDRYYFEHAGQAGSFTPYQVDEIRRTSLARLLCRTGNLHQVPQYAFLQPSQFNPMLNCSQLGEIDYNKF